MFSTLSPTLLEKVKKIRLLILDVDGILTTGALFYGPKGESIKTFHVHDGLGIQLLQKFSVKIAIISSKKSPAVMNRLKHLTIKYLYLGSKNKLLSYNDLKQKLRLSDDAIAYMGDDLPDLPVLQRVGLAITVPEALEIVQQHVHWVTKHPGGQGAVREVCDTILFAQNHYESMLKPYLEN